MNICNNHFKFLISNCYIIVLNFLGKKKPNIFLNSQKYIYKKEIQYIGYGLIFYFINYSKYKYFSTKSKKLQVVLNSYLEELYVFVLFDFSKVLLL
jgi:hypothetical protein